MNSLPTNINEQKSSDTGAPLSLLTDKSVTNPNISQITLESTFYNF